MSSLNVYVNFERVRKDHVHILDHMIVWNHVHVLDHVIVWDHVLVWAYVHA